MDKQFELLYLATVTMLIIAIMFIILVAWVSKKLSDQNKVIRLCMEKTESIEALVRTEFAAVLNQLKKI